MKPVVVFLAWVFLTGSAHAQNINYQDFNEEGFGNVAQLLQVMTPQQRAAIIQQANSQQQELQKLTPQQQATLLRKLHDTANTIDFSKIDPSKLDMSKMKGLADTQNDLTKYQQQNSQ